MEPLLAVSRFDWIVFQTHYRQFSFFMKRKGPFLQQIDYPDDSWICSDKRPDYYSNSGATVVYAHNVQNYGRLWDEQALNETEDDKKRAIVMACAER